MARRRRIALYVTLGTLVTTVAALAVLVKAGPALARGLAEDYISEATGRAFTIGSPVEIDWGRQLGLTVQDVTLANADWADSSDMLSLGRAHVVVDLWSLLAGPVYLERVEVDDLVLHLQARDDEPANWQFQPESEATPSRPDTAQGKAALPLLVRHIEANNLNIHVSGPILDRPMDLFIRQIRQDVQPDETGVLALDGTLNEQPLSVEARAGPVAHIVEGQDIDYALTGRLGEMSVDAKGTLDDLFAPGRPTGEFTLAGPDIGALTERLGLGRLGEGDYELTASLAPREDLLVVRSQGRIGRIEIDVDGSVRDFAGLDGIDLTAHVSGPAIGRILHAFGLEGPDEPFEFRTDLARDGPKLRVADTRFRVAEARLELTARLDHFPTLDDARIDLLAEGPDIEKVRSLLQVPGLATGPFTIEGHVTVDPDGAERVSLTGQTNLGQLRLDGRIGDPGNYVGTTLSLGLEGENLATVGRAIGLDHFVEKPYSVSGNVAIETAGQARLRNAVVSVGDHRAEAAGLVPLGHLPAGIDLAVSASGPDLAVVLAMTGVRQGIPAEAYEAQGQLVFEKQGLKLTDVRGTVGSASLTGGGFVAFTRGAVGTDLNVRVAGPDLHVALAPPEARRYAPSADFEARGRIRVTGEGVAFDDVEGNVAAASIRGHGLVATRPGLVGSRLEVTTSGPDLARVAPELPSFSPPPGPFELSGRLERGQDFLALQQVRLGYGGTTGRMEIRLATPLDRGATSFDVELKGSDAKVLPLATGFEPNALPFTVEARGEWDTGNWRIADSQLRLGDASASLSGQLSGLPDKPDGQLDFRATAPSLAALGTMRGERLPDLPLDISATLAGANGRLELGISSARLGRTDAHGQVAFRPGEVPRLDIELHSTRLDTWQLRGEGAGSPGAGESEPAKAPGARVIPDTPLPLEPLRRLDIEIDYSADELGLRTSSARDARLRATLLDGALRVEELHITGDVGNLGGTLELIPDGAGAELSLEVQATDLRTFFVAGRDTSALPLFSARLDLRGRGETWSELAADLDGHGWFTSKDGEVPNNQLSGLLLGDFFTEVFTTINPFAKTEPMTQIECVAIPFTVERGKISTIPAWAMRTSRLDIGAWGAIDLATEKIDFNFKTQPRKGLGISASQMVNPFMKIMGTLSEPQLTLDPSGSLVTGTATVITGGAWLLFKGAFDSLLREKDPCGKVMKEYRKTLEKPKNTP